MSTTILMRPIALSPTPIALPASVSSIRRWLTLRTPLAIGCASAGCGDCALFAVTDSAARSLDDPRTFPVWERAGALAIPICVCTRFRELPRLRTTIERFPDVTVALDHLGLPRLDGGPPYASVQPLFDLARMPNVYLKFSTVNMDSSRSGSSTPRAFFDRLLEHFGSHRMMWGSNFPATHDRSLKEQFALARNELAFLSDEDQRWIFGETALSLWPSLR